MLFTKESDYAIRVIRALQDGGKKTIKELCELEQIPSAFGYKILQKMNKSGSIAVTTSYNVNSPISFAS